MSQTARFEFRVHPDAKARIERAATFTDESTSEFARTAALERADAILRRNEVTVVPSDFFDSLLAELDAADEPNKRLAAAARRSRSALQREG